MQRNTWIPWIDRIGFLGVMLLAVLWGAPVTRAADGLLFADLFDPDFASGSIRRVNTDGTGLSTILDVGGGLWGLETDLAAGKMYWTDVNNFAIRRANLDGGGIEDLVTTGLEFPSGLGLHLGTQQLFWGDQTAEVVGRAGINGENPEVIRSTAFHRGIAVDSVNDKLYWSTSISQFKGEILRSNLDGSGLETVVTSNDARFKPAQMALDLAGGKIYWTDYVVDVVRRSNLDGTNIETLFVAPFNRNPRGITLDLAGGKVYWGQDIEIEGLPGKIMRMNLDGTQPETIIEGLGLVNEIVFVPEPATGGLLLVALWRSLRRR